MVDAHLDLALNALEWNRDLTRPIAEIRAAEMGMNDKPGRGAGTVCLPEIRRGGVGLVVATQIAKVADPKSHSAIAQWQSPEEAWAATQRQLAWYRAMEELGEVKMIHGRKELDTHVATWNSRDEHGGVIGLVLSLEGADSLVSIGHLERAYEAGLRAVGPAHYGNGIYAAGTGADGGLTSAGRDLLAEMARLEMILDVTHLTDQGFWEALELYPGAIWASHHNCRALVPDQRQLADDQIRALIDRDAVMGMALDAWMLVPGWVRGETTPAEVGLRLETVVDQVEHICELAGNANHVGLGSDLDGAFGREQTPLDVDTIADVQRIPEIMEARGFSQEDREKLASGNFLRVLRRALR